MDRVITPAFPFILAIGDSLTAGYGLPPSASFPARLQAGLRKCWPDALVQNAGVSGDTTEGGLRRLPRLLASLRAKPDLAIVEFGANDLLRGIAPERTRTNLDTMLVELGRCDIPTLLATFEPPPMLGAFGARYAGIYASVAVSRGAATAPFFPPGVLGHPELVLADRVHPNAQAIEIVTKAFVPAVVARFEKGLVQAS